MEDIKSAYAEEINKLVQNCDDVSLLDLVYKILIKENK